LKPFGDNHSASIINLERETFIIQSISGQLLAGQRERWV